MKKGFYLTLGVVLSSCLPAGAQTIATNLPLKQEGPPPARSVARDFRSTDISRSKYGLRFIGEEDVRGQRCYELELLPRRNDKDLLGQYTMVSHDVKYAIGEAATAESPATTRIPIRGNENYRGPAWMQKQLIPALGVVLDSSLPPCAQTRLVQLSLTHQRPEPKMTLHEEAPSRWPQAAWLPEEPPQPPTALLVLAYKRFLGPEHLLQMETVQTPFVRQSNVTLVRLWSGRLQLSGFERSQRMEALLNGYRGPGVSLPLGLSVPRAESSYGASLTFHLGRDAQR